MNWQNYPLIRLVIPFTLGMVGANLFICHMDRTVLFILCCAVLALLFFFIPQQEGTYKDYKFGVVAMIFAFLVGMTLYTGKHHSITQGIPQDSTFCKGILTEMPVEKARSWALNLEQENGTHILLYVGSPITPEAEAGKGLGLSLGDTIRAHIIHLNPTDQTEDETFRPFYNYLFSNDICATCYAPRGQWTVRPRQGKPSLLQQAKSIQEKMHRIYDDRGINGEAGSIVEAMTLGRKADLSPTTRQAYATSGVSHVLALSGFHVGIIVLMLHALFLHRLFPLRWRWVSNLLVIIALWSYALITGMSPSLVRATLMFTILLLCQSFSQETLSIDSCTLTFFIMLCINPFYLQNIGFQLSFVSVGSIALYGSPLLRRYMPAHFILRLLWGILVITLLCSLFTAPLVAHHFGCLPLLSLVSNLAIFLFVHLVMYGSLLWWLFLWCDPINSILTDLLNWTADTMNSITHTIAALPYASIEWHPNALTTLLCYIPLLILGYFIKHFKNERL